MRNTIQYLQQHRIPAAVLMEVADLINQVGQLAGRVAMVAGGVAGLEALLDHHGLLTPEAMEAVKAKMTAQLSGVPEQTPEQEPEQTPSAG
jgi:hypothetical protein